MFPCHIYFYRSRRTPSPSRWDGRRKWGRKNMKCKCKNQWRNQSVLGSRSAVRFEVRSTFLLEMCGENNVLFCPSFPELSVFTTTTGLLWNAYSHKHVLLSLMFICLKYNVHWSLLILIFTLDVAGTKSPNFSRRTPTGFAFVRITPKNTTTPAF